MTKLTSEQKEKVLQTARNMRRHILDMITKAKSGHPGGSLSMTDALALLYEVEMNIDPKNPDWDMRDRLVLSKGHGAPGLYAVLAEKGFFPVEELSTLRQVNSRLQGHPEMKHTPGVDATTGSLGQGISAACGLAMAAKMDGSTFHTFAILGDGELQEGQVWEAAMFAGHYHLDTLTALVDNNGLQIDGDITKVMSPLPIADKFKAFQWHVREVDGHNIEELHDAIVEARQVKDQPSVIIMKTVKGKGIAEMENKASWHGKAPSQEEFVTFMAELEAN